MLFVISPLSAVGNITDVFGASPCGIIELLRTADPDLRTSTRSSVEQ
jgi:hypothetical protein